jgi:hypothetical protein
MDELDRRREVEVMRALVAAEPRGGDREQRPQPLAAGLDQVRRHLGNARRVFARHALADQAVHRLHVGGEQVREAFDRRDEAGGRVHRACLSTSSRAVARVAAMKEILRSTDPTIIAFSTALLRAEDIDCFVLDVHMSILEGGIGVFPRRLAVADRDAFRARAILSDNAVDGVVP